LISYKDQILKSFSLEAMTIELQALTKRVRESEERRERETRTRNYPLIGFRKPEERKAENQDTSEASKADDPESAKENALKTA